MAKYRITGPDGGTYEITAPDDASEAEVLAYAQRNAGMTQAPEELASTPPPVSPRQAEDQSMAALARYEKGPEAAMNALPKGLRVPLQTLRDSVTGIGQGLTFNFGDEIQAGLATPLEMIRNKTLDVGGSYDNALAAARGEQKLAETRSPVANTIGQIAGGTALGGGLSGNGVTLLNAAKPTIASMAGRGALEGAAYGGAYGFGAGEGQDDRLKRAGVGAAVGAVTGGATGLVGGAMAKRAANKTIPSTEQLKQAANNAYREVDQAGVVLESQSFSNAVDDIVAAAKKAGVDKTIHPKATAALARLEEAKGSQPAMGDVDILRRVIGGARGSIEADERRIGGIMADKLDDYINGLKPADVIAGDPLKATSALNKARDLWSRTKKSEMIEQALGKADLRAASTGSGGNIDNATRQNIRAILDNQKKARGFTKEERDLMEKIVRGGPVQNLLRLVGKLSPTGNGLMGAMSIGATAHNPLLAAFPAAGMASKGAADRMTAKTVDTLSRTIRSGGQLPQVQQLSGPQRALLEGLLVNSSQQGQRPFGLLD